MLLVPTEIRPSKIHKLGLFAITDIKTGYQISSFVEGFDRRFTAEEYATLPVQAQQFLWYHGYQSPNDGLWRLNMDNIRFINHSAQPNTYQDGDDDFAVRTIKAGDEITADYFSFDADAAKKDVG